MKSQSLDPSELHFGYFFPSGKTNFLYSDEAASTRPDMNKANLLALAQAAEDVGFDSLFIADNWSGHQRAAERGGHQSPAYHAPLLAMALFAATEHIGVTSTFHTTHHHPTHVARMGATLDAFSDGRWAWNVVTGFSADETALFGEDFIEHDERYRMASEFVEVVEALWSEGEPIDHKGTYYRAKGRIKLPRPAAKPRPLLVSAGASPAGTAFAARHCDQLVAMGNSVEMVAGAGARLAEQTAVTGREVGLCPFSMALIREGDGEAEEVFERLLTSLNIDATKEIATDVIGSIESTQEMWAEMGVEKAARAFGAAGSMLKFIGTPAHVAEQILELKKSTDATNLLINFPLWSPAELQTFAPVLEILREAGVWSPPADRNHSW
ncbi:LLM class flavin-dependent oxidoreductase [Gordonia rhizosphera]|uniref:Putative FMNH2-dependent dimethyl sulfone monooxygenase n=1 Tax=Gordonia rhizosphera NBRC 16068 TaxID=1108045 RepID=K6WFN5_9ACTN|nr:LLM class flavin-dependent oxidoreductase [Gordonia rhizosphera]GAB92586.1 putative FMNH2-dependent dimethyl sulfone monooxygenase [Gordonia rhizosphera NBRC 16068]